ncbi:MAG: hypothetical protein LBR10_04645 [Prevotellaceae bacterium]|nr:hypothetical protein [Prevotellaceae bacterium]
MKKPENIHTGFNALAFCTGCSILCAPSLKFSVHQLLISAKTELRFLSGSRRKIRGCGNPEITCHITENEILKTGFNGKTLPVFMHVPPGDTYGIELPGLFCWKNQVVLTEQKQEVYGKVRDMYDQKDEAQEKFLAIDEHIRQEQGTGNNRN